MDWRSSLGQIRSQKIFAFVSIGIFIVVFVANIALYFNTVDHTYEFDQPAFILAEAATFVFQAAAFTSVLLSLYKIADQGICYTVYFLTQGAVCIMYVFMFVAGLFYSDTYPKYLIISWVITAIYAVWAAVCWVVHLHGRQTQRKRRNVNPMPDPDA